ncbi:MAG: aspartate carbamoyltransferase catalytic subunit [Leptolyngbya sp. PLA3]|nr:MAG: aspartate carbamoyltransferase catalytic subunit [Cyanobacteria bacterium CYA]MCE7967389.1 aspartate carbamoyltransferase catalytic subunit [Leptolyngbya sp. PL-A3]
MTVGAAPHPARTSASGPPGGTARNLIGIASEPIERMRGIVREARRIEPSQVLQGRLVASVFFEDSTRTKTSFVLAARNLSATTIDLSTGSSSVNKGETVIDTAGTLSAMGVDAVIVRAKQSGVPGLIARHLPGMSVINAGDGRHEHPTQALGDALTIAEAFDRQDLDFSGLRVAIVGDINASRVARSNMALLRGLGASVVCAGPPTLVSGSLRSLGVDVVWSMDQAMDGANVVMMLRIQFERYAAGRGAISSPREYRQMFGLTDERSRRLGSDVVVMHPGPTNRGLEIDPAAADGLVPGGARSLIRTQVANGVRTRMAVLRDCLTPG